MDLLIYTLSLSILRRIENEPCVKSTKKTISIIYEIIYKHFWINNINSLI